MPRKRQGQFDEDEFRTLVAKGETHAAIAALKSSGAYKRPELAPLIDSLATDRAEFVQLLEEMEALNDVEASLLQAIGDIGTHFSSRDDELVHTLLAFENFFRAMLKFPCLSEIPVAPGFADARHYKSKMDEWFSLDHFITYFGVALKALTKKSSGVAIPIDADKIALAATHLAIAGNWQVFFEHRAFWEQGCTQVMVGEDELVLDSANSDLIRAMRLSLARLRAFRFARIRDPLPDAAVESGCTRLPTAGFRSEDERRSAYMIHLQFYSDALSEQVHGASLGEWLRAYTVLKEIAGQHVRNQDEIQTGAALLFRAEKKFFVEAFVAAGIKNSTANLLFDFLVFDSSSHDILDTPLFPYGDEHMLLPLMCMIIEPASSLESRLRSIRANQNHELGIIGKGLEKNVKTDLRRAGFAAHRLKTGDVECDAAFIMDDTLFLCECKGKYQAVDFRLYKELESYLMEEVVAQHRRTCEFYENNLQHVRHKFALPAGWKPQRICRLIITSAKLGRTLKVEDFLIVDENIFHAYFSKIQARLTSERGIEETYEDERIAAPFATSTFLDYLAAPQVIDTFSRMQEPREFSLTIGDRVIVVRDVECFGEVAIR